MATTTIGVPEHAMIEDDVPAPGRGPDDPALGLYLPEAKMWVAVLRGVLVDLRSKRYREGARRWLVSTSTEIGSFTWICESLKIEPGPLRTRLLSVPKARLSVVRATQPAESQPDRSPS
jgi:hypothetical protein